MQIYQKYANNYFLFAIKKRLVQNVSTVLKYDCSITVITILRLVHSLVLSLSTDIIITKVVFSLYCNHLKSSSQ